MPAKDVQLVKELYDRFNARDIEGVLSALADDVTWANAMDGGHVHGHEGVRDYWTRQWGLVDPKIEPTKFEQTENVITVEVIQSIFDLNGQPLSGQTHSLKDKTVLHVFQIDNSKIKRFDVQEKN